jgi:hypothetical protein
MASNLIKYADASPCLQNPSNKSDCVTWKLHSNKHRPLPSFRAVPSRTSSPELGTGWSLQWRLEWSRKKASRPLRIRLKSTARVSRRFRRASLFAVCTTRLVYMRPCLSWLYYLGNHTKRRAQQHYLYAYSGASIWRQSTINTLIRLKYPTISCFQGAVAPPFHDDTCNCPLI